MMTSLKILCIAIRSRFTIVFGLVRQSSQKKKASICSIHTVFFVAIPPPKTFRLGRPLLMLLPFLLYCCTYSLHDDDALLTTPT